MVKNLFSRLLSDQRGNTAIIFAGGFVTLMLAGGSAFDYSKAVNLRLKLQAATDSVALLLCKVPGATAAQLQQTASAHIQGFLPNNTIALDPLEVSSNPRQVTLTSRINYPTIFMKIAQITNVPLSAKATCSAQEAYFEIALSLDNTGSMNNSGGSGSKMEALRQAASNFVDFMFTSGALPGHVKISLVPFAASVAVDPGSYRTASWIDQQGKSSLHWQNVVDPASASLGSRFDIFAKLNAASLSWDWAGCFESLAYPLNVQDGAPTPANPSSYYVPMLNPDEPGDGGAVNHVETSSGLTQTYPNSYLDDQTTDAGCNTAPADDLGRLGRACKYVKPQGVTTTNAYGPTGPNARCTSRPLTRLTADKGKLLSEIGALQARGNTNIHEGFMWGWRTISPSSMFADGTPYNQPNTTKVVVLMTDGTNTWGVTGANTVTKSLYSAYGYVGNADGSGPNARLSPSASISPSSPSEAQARTAIDRLTSESCQSARSAGVTIYAVGFSVPTDPIDQQGLNLLAGCAGSPDRSFVANDSAGLTAAFAKIGQSITNLRLTR